MKKQIIINNIKKYNDYKNLYDVSNNIKTLKSNVVKDVKLSYIELLEKPTKLNANDLCCNILDLYDNYDKQIININNIYKESSNDNQKTYITQHFLQALKKKLASYKQQDKKKTCSSDCVNFITLANVIEQGITDSEVIQDKIKKTYKNRYFILTQNNK